MVCGFELVIAIFSPTKALIKVDLPVLGLPSRLTNPDLVNVSDQYADDSLPLGFDALGGELKVGYRDAFATTW